MTQQKTITAVNQSPVVAISRLGDKIYTLNKNNEAHCFKDPGFDQALCEIDCSLEDLRGKFITLDVRYKLQ